MPTRHFIKVSSSQVPYKVYGIPTLQLRKQLKSSDTVEYWSGSHVLAVLPWASPLASLGLQYRLDFSKATFSSDISGLTL